MKILILGGAGFVGSNLLRVLVEKYPNYQLIALDNLSRGSKENLDKFTSRSRVDFVDLDITNETALQNLIANFSPEVVVNAVHSNAEPEFIKVNAYGQYVVLETLRKHAPELEKFIYLSSDEVYGETFREDGSLRPSNESDPPRPQTVAAASQAGSELLCQAYFNQYNLPTTILRVSNVFGPYQDPKRLLPLLINHALENKPLPLYGDGQHSRDWLYVGDLVKLLDEVIHAEASEVVGEIFNVTGNLEISVLEVSELILAQLGKSKDLIEFVEDERPHTRRRILDGTKLSQRLPWQPETDFKEALAETITWYRS